MHATPYGQYPCFDRSQRPLHVLVSGAGPSGIAMAIGLKKLSNVTFHVFEKNHDVGGTWLENRYPGAACDIASHAYQYTFHSKTDWSSQYALPISAALFSPSVQLLTIRSAFLRRKRSDSILPQWPRRTTFTPSFHSALG